MLSKLWNTSSSRNACHAFDREGLKRFREDTHGGVMAYFGIMLPVLIGVSGLALDASLWYAQKRSTQAIADTAAYSVILEMQRTGNETLAENAAKADAVVYGLDESAGDSIDFNFPPKYGAYAGTGGYYEVVVERPAPVFLASLVLDDFDVAARAVSGGANGGAPPCILANDPNMKDAFKVNGGTVKASGCDIQVNSDHVNSALNVASGGVIEADPVNIVGGYDNKGTISSTPNVDMPEIADPLSGLATPGFSGCDYSNLSFDSGTHVLSPGVYCGGISVSGDAEVTMQSGEYVITEGTDPKNGKAITGTLAVSGSDADITGDGVSVYFDGDSEVNITGNGDIDLTAPSSGTYTGILFFGDPTAPPATEHMINGNGDTIFDGFMYFPTAIAKINGNGEANTDAEISAIIARQLRFGGNGALDFHINEGAILPPSMQTKMTLVE